MESGQWWDAYYRKHGHTGCTDPSYYAYNQPLKMRAVARRIPEGTGRALDIGCGTGDVVAVLRRKGYAVTGIDISEAVARDTAKRFAGDAQVLIRASSLGEVSGSFDIITSVTAMQHIPEAELLDGLRRLEAPRMIALEIAPLGKFAKAESEVFERTASEWRTLFLKAGWSVSEEHTFAPWGPVLVIQFNRLVRALVGGAAPSSDASPASRIQTPTVKRRVLRFGYRFARKSLLWAGWPLDILGLQAPWAYYRIFVLSRAAR